MPSAPNGVTEPQEPPATSPDSVENLSGTQGSGLTRIDVDVTALERVGRLFEREATELAGITVDLRGRLSNGLLNALPAGVAERITEGLSVCLGALDRLPLICAR